MPILKALRFAERGLVHFSHAINKYKLGAENIHNLFQAVTLDVEAAALERSIFCKGAQNKMPARL